MLEAHRRIMIRIVVLALLIPGLACGLASGQETKPAAKDTVTYKDHVLPLLRKHCLNCHNADKASSDLDVSTYQAVMAGGASGEAVKAGNPGQSLLYRVTAHEVEPKMPPKGGKIPEADLAVLKKWIEAGAPETAVGAAKSASRKVEIDPVALTTGKPSGPPPMPANWASVSFSKTERPHAVTAMAASPWAPLLAVASHERVLLYNTDTLKLVGTLAFPERIPFVLKFSRNGKWLLAAGGRGASSGKVVIWDVVSGRRVTEIGDEADIVLAADISANHQLVALGGPGKLVKIYDTATGELKHKIKKHTDWVTAMAFSPNGELLATGDRNGGAYIWEADTGGIVFTLGDHKDSITDLSWRADSQMLATVSEDGRAILWYADDGFPTRQITAQADNRSRSGKPIGVLAVDYARNGNILTAGRDKTARIWRPDGSQVAKFEGFTDLPTRVAFSHDGARVFVGDFTGTIRVWSATDSKPLGQLSTNPD